jgi:hypothetical protein
MPWLRPDCRPPTFTTSTVFTSVFASSSWKWVLTLTRSPTNFCGQWHCSQVSRAGRRLWTGTAIGRG